MQEAAQKASRIILMGLGGLRESDENFVAFVNEGARIILREWLHAIEEAIKSEAVYPWCLRGSLHNNYPQE